MSKIIKWNNTTYSSSGIVQQTPVFLDPTFLPPSRRPYGAVFERKEKEAKKKRDKSGSGTFNHSDRIERRRIV